MVLHDLAIPASFGVAPPARWPPPHIMMTVRPWRRWVSRVGYGGLLVLVALHIAVWCRAYALGGFWGHLNEATRWLQIIALVSLLVAFCCVFGIGWKRWAGAAFGIASFVMAFLYAAGL